MQTLSQKRHYLSTLREAQAFISLDPNLLRFPEVVLERIQIKIEDDPSCNTEEKDSQVKSERDWRAEKAEPQEKNEAAPVFHPAGTEDGAVYPGAEDSKECNGETAPVKSHEASYGESGRKPPRSGYNGPSKQIGRNPGRRKKGGWHPVHRERQQFDRKLKKHCAIYVEEERQRGQRFSEEENEVLIEGVLAYYKELCGYSSLKGSASRKRHLWQEVVNKVNSIGMTYRTIEVCKKRYGDCRRAVKLKMAALEHQAMGWGGSHEQIKFNNWEEKLRQKIISVTMNGAQRVLDTGRPSSLELCDSNDPSSTPQQCSSWAPTTETSAVYITPTCDPVSDYDEAFSPLDIQLISEWSEEEAPCTPATPVPNEGMNAAETQSGTQLPAPNMTHIMNGPETSLMDQQHHLQLQEEHNKSLRHLTQAHNVELHKLRENMVEGNARMVQQLEGLVSEVRELNAHVQQIHVNQTHFNHMFQNYIADTKMFYGSIVQAIKSLKPPTTVSPLASPTSSPVSSPKYSAAQTDPNPMTLTAAMFDSTSMSPAGSAEPASASSTASEVNQTIRRRGRKPGFRSQPQKKH
ncbi:myb-related transcription factor, partner of profilin-like [Hyla sarda]|uniref:myb-related transcription factor, partner of profilin-like n=1 Tax=Hyla sarda TaxID=327740 RepID=UPI0024C316A2|nr:myb-related transcription factor, partner of profilin-like [Hyla sarda]